MQKITLMVFTLVFSVILTACGGDAAEPTALPVLPPTLTLVPTLQASPLPTLQPSITPEPDVTPIDTPIPVQAVAEEDVILPLTMNLPDGWQYGSGVQAINDIGELRIIPYGLYTGAVTGGQGFIVVLWDFPNATAGNLFIEDGAEPDLYVDGLRLLRLVILERECVIGTDLKMEYSIGGRVASGTQFSTTNCPDIQDTRGWFAGVFEQQVPFVFYAYTEPITAMDGAARTELQTMLDSVQFTLPTSNN